MSQIKAEVVTYSQTPQGDKLLTVLVTFPRYILAELNTHRMLSKNSASSRAIPFKKMVESVQNNSFIPIAWQKEHKGMQGSEYLSEEESNECRLNWLGARDKAIRAAIDLTSIGCTKQLANRLLEPFMMHTVLITGTVEGGWDNFFDLRCPQYTQTSLDNDEFLVFKSKKEVIKFYNKKEDDFTADYWFKINKGMADIHMMQLAECIYDAMNEATPKQLKAGEWHVPFEDKINLQQLELLTSSQKQEVIIKVSSAMAARTSYTIVGDEKEFTLRQQLDLHDRMASAVPFHASPFEHCAKVMTQNEYEMYYRGKSTYLKADGGIFPYEAYGWCRNFRGFIQYREILEQQNKTNGNTNRN